MLRAPVAKTLERLAPPSPASALFVESNGSALDAESGRFLEALAAARPGGTILELGAGASGATLWLARGARNASITAVAASEGELVSAREIVARISPASEIAWDVGAARAAAEAAGAEIDLAVVDTGADEARRLVDLLLPKLAVGGAIAILRALRDQLPATRSALAAEERAALERLRPYLLIHPQLASTLVPLGEGILLAVKRRETIRELGGPY